MKYCNFVEDFPNIPAKFCSNRSSCIRGDDQNVNVNNDDLGQRKQTDDNISPTAR